MTTTDPSSSVDARRPYEMKARALSMADTRSRIVGAAIERFFEEHYDVVTLDQIAAIAGVSRQTVLNHFSDKESLFLEAASHVGDERERARADDPDGALTILLEGYEFAGDTMIRLLSVRGRIPALEQWLDAARRRHQDWLVGIWGDRLPTAAPERQERLLALHAATDIYVWRLLRRDMGLELPAIHSIMRRLIRGALAETDPTTRLLEGSPA